MQDFRAILASIHYRPYIEVLVLLLERQFENDVYWILFTES